LFLFRTEICIEILIESGIGKTLKYFLDYCKCYESDMPDLKGFINNTEQIIIKWKNFLINTVFDESKNN
jgi:hypothetical protein